MKDTANDQFIFRRTSTSRKAVEHLESERSSGFTQTLPPETRHQPCIEKDKLMTDRKEQIEMLIAAKADVQKQLDSIFAEESDKLIAAISHLSQVDPESAAQFLAQTTYAHFNAQDETTRSGLIDSFSSAFGAMAEHAKPKGATGWEHEDAAQMCQEEMQDSIDAA